MSYQKMELIKWTVLVFVRRAQLAQLAQLAQPCLPATPALDSALGSGGMPLPLHRPLTPCGCYCLPSAP